MTAAIVVSAFAFVAIVDPYDSLAFSPPWKRYRITTNERYAFPGMIRHGRFDSAVFGTSTIMLLKPAELDKGSADASPISPCRTEPPGNRPR